MIIEEDAKSKNLEKLLSDNIGVLIRAVELDDKILIRKVWMRNTELRKNLNIFSLQDLILQTIPKGNVLQRLLGSLDIASKDKMKTEKVPQLDPAKEIKEPKEEPLMEVEAYLTLLLVSSLIQEKKFSDAIELSYFLLDRLRKVNRQTLDSFVSKAYSFLCISSERLQADDIEENLFRELLKGQKMCSLRMYEQAEATLINFILRKYIAAKNFNGARLFLEATSSANILNSSNVPNNEQIRYLYYTGKVSAVESNYSESDTAITRAVRKCPTNTGLGFRLSLNKLHIVAKLLTGEIPERSLFYDVEMRKELEPYFHLVKSVRIGSVADYNKILATYKNVFLRDDLYTLIQRLKSAVVKTGLRNINLSYSKINFKDIMEKLELKTEKDAELICAKAIRDQIIENAIVDPVAKVLLSTETIDVYSSTLEPKAQFNSRTDFCVQVHNAAMKAHKYPPNSHKPKKDAGKKEEADDEEELYIDSGDDLME